MHTTIYGEFARLTLYALDADVDHVSGEHAHIFYIRDLHIGTYKLLENSKPLFERD